MPLLVASLESDLLTLVGPYLRVCGLDHETNDGSNPSLRIPIRRAARAMGVSITESTVADADLSGVTGDDQETLLELAELRTLELCWGNWPEYDEQAGDEKQSMSQLADRLERRIKVLTDKLGALASETVAASVPGASASGLIREGLYIPPVATSSRYRQSFWHNGRYYA